MMLQSAITSTTLSLTTSPGSLQAMHELWSVTNFAHRTGSTLQYFLDILSVSLLLIIGVRCGSAEEAIGSLRLL